MKSLFYMLPGPVGEQPFSLLGAARVQAKPGLDRYDRTDYEQCTVEYIVKGAGVLESNGFACQPRQGDIYILHKGSSHSYWPDDDDPWGKICFVVDGWLMEDLFRAYGFSAVHYVPQASSAKPLFEAMLRLAESKAPDLHDKAAVLFHRLLVEMQRIAGKPADRFSPTVQTLLTFIDRNVARPVSMREMGTEVHRSVSHLTRLFKKETGITPYEYLLRQRMEVAKALLTGTRLPVKEIAARLGFGDQYYFCNAFKKAFNAAPTRYRRRKSST